MNNEALIKKFYDAFVAGNSKEMVACYHDDVTFTDPAFGTIQGDKAKAMWHMLIERGKGANKVTYSNVTATEEKGSSQWIAKYPYGDKKRPVVNHVEASFTFKDGKIYTHQDDFNLYKWSKQALGVPGFLLGWTGFMRGKIQQQTNALLTKYMNGE